jgi:glycine cleavage system H protein
MKGERDMEPEGLRFTKDHEWIRVEKDGEAVVGITDFAQHELGDITFIDLPKPGKTVQAREQLAVVESVKAASDIYSPVAGTVSAVNTALADAPETVNKDPYGEGWFCRLTGCDLSGLEDMMTAERYTRFVAER